MDGKTLVFILVVGGIILVISFIGEKIVDGAFNAMRPKKKNPDGTPRYTSSGSLASRYNPSAPAQATPPAPVAPNPTAPATAPISPKFCDKCGNTLTKGDKFCRKCGRQVG